MLKGLTPLTSGIKYGATYSSATLMLFSFRKPTC